MFLENCIQCFYTLLLKFMISGLHALSWGVQRGFNSTQSSLAAGALPSPPVSAPAWRWAGVEPQQRSTGSLEITLCWFFPSESHDGLQL